MLRARLQFLHAATTTRVFGIRDFDHRRSARGRRAAGCGADRTTTPASRPSMRPWTTASTGSTRRRSTARDTRKPSSAAPCASCPRRAGRSCSRSSASARTATNPVKSATRAQVLAECDASLRRLGVDAIDLYQLHWPVEQPIPETAAACAELLKAGKIRAIGVSNYSVAQLEAWRATGVPLHSVQSPYSLLRPAVAADVLPFCAKTGHRRDRLFAALPRHAVRHVEEGQDVPRGRHPRRAQGLPGRPLRATPRRHRRAARPRRRERPERAAARGRRAAAHARA